jgi:uncharacterized membrane protein (DUF485 family)
MNIDPAVFWRTETVTAFRRLGWAFPWLVLDFRLRVNDLHVDLLADVVGWWLCISAFQQLRDLHPSVSRVSRICWLGLVLALPWLATYGTNFPGEPQLPGYAVTQVWILARALVWIAFIWLLLGIVGDVGMYLERPELTVRAQQVRVASAALTIVGTLIALLQPFFPLPGPLIFLAALVGFVLGMALAVLIVLMLRRVAWLIETATP